MPSTGSTRTAMLTAFLHHGSDNVHVDVLDRALDSLQPGTTERKPAVRAAGRAKIVDPTIG